MINISNQTSSIYKWTFELAESAGLHDQATHILTSAILLVSAFVLLALIDYLLRFFFNSVVIQLLKKTKGNWESYLLDNKIQVHVSRFILVAVAQRILPMIFTGFSSFTVVIDKVLAIVMIFLIYRVVNSLLKTGRDILRSSKAFLNKPIDSYLQVLQIFLIFIVITLTVSVLTGNSPWSFLVSLGAASAVLMLVFKDTILGFVASIQVSANDSVRVGDWIEMPKYGVDGDILEINLNNVRVQNWDKTIVTIPTYTLLSDSLKNYRGMQETGGRRIKRSINIKISTIRYMDAKEIEELKKIAVLVPFIEQREQQIRDYNIQHNVDPDVLVNGRRMTNIGLFRAYITSYAKKNPDINQGMTLMVRQLAPNEHGLPLELYMFTNGTSWAFFEDTMSDVFDHLFAAVKYFDLEVFELPSSDDLRQILKKQTVNDQ
ncbi:Miniconductance mechanosensitive channel YbdG [compost metagenome]